MTDTKKRTRAPKPIPYEVLLAEIKGLALETKLLLRNELNKDIDGEHARLQQQLELINGSGK